MSATTMTATVRCLREFLRARSAMELAGIIAARPRATAEPRPVTLHQLAVRLADPRAAAAALEELPTSYLQVAEAVCAAVASDTEADTPALVDTARVAGLLGAEDAADVDAVAGVLDELAQRCLAWPMREPNRSRVCVHPQLLAVFPQPLGLGPPLASLLGKGFPDIAPARLLVTLGASTTGNLETDRAALAQVLADGQRVRTVMDGAAPEQVRPVLQGLVNTGRHYVLDPYPGLRRSPTPAWREPVRDEADQALEWLREHGLVATRFDHQRYTRAGSWVLLPRELALALRGPGWRGPFTPVMPAPPTTTVTAQRVTAGAAGAGALAVDTMTTLLRVVGETPLVCRKTSLRGVGVKEVRRLAVAVGCPLAQVRLWLWVGQAAGLLAVTEPRHNSHTSAAATVATTTAVPGWLALPAAQRWMRLVSAWCRLDTLPTATTWPTRYTPSGAATDLPAPLADDATVPEAPAARRTVLAVLAELPADQAVPNGAELAAALRWQAPGLFLPEEETTRSVLDERRGQRLDAAAIGASVLAEAELLGVTSGGAATPLGHALATGDTSGLVDAAKVLLPSATTVRFQADHTAVVTGAPDPGLADLLDACAEQETRGHVHTWRISTASVRAFLDDGHGTAADLLVRLEAVAAGGVPQPVRYLITDVGRRHGHLTVMPSVTVIHAEDETLLAQVAADRAVAKLRLRLLAATVLLSAAGREETVAVLRTAGYLPAVHDAAGNPVLTLHPRTTRADPGEVPEPDSEPTAVVPAAAADTGWIARLAAEEAEPELTGAAADIHRQAPALGAADCQLLATAVANRSPIVIEYTHDMHGTGPASTDTLRRPVLSGDRLINLTTAGTPGRTSHPLNQLRMVHALPAPRRRRT